MPAGQRDRRGGARSSWWSAAAAIAVLLAARWLRAPDLPYLVATVCATVATLALAAPRRGPGTSAARAASVLLTAFALAGMAGQYALWRIDQFWPAVSQDVVARAQGTAQQALGRLSASLTRTATRALDAPSDPPAAFDAVRRVLGQAVDPERGIVLYRNGGPVAWAGTIRTPPSDAPGLSVTWSDFYVTLQAAVTRGASRAVATVLLHADPPADRLSMALDEVITRRTGVSGLAFNRAGGDTLVTVEPIAPRVDVARPAAIERARRRGVALLALAVIAFIGAEWYPRAPLGRRLAALLLPVAVIAIVPLNTLSNLSAVFDPTYFYSTIGGPLTASIGALALTSAVAALGALALVQAGVRVRSRPLAAAIAVAVSAATPYFVRELAEGITSPGSGVPVELWIVWQLTLALAGVALLCVAVVAGRSALRTSRGAAPGVAIALAVIAAVLGVLLWRPPTVAGWPAAYIGLWIAAAAAAAFASGTRPRITTVTVVAGCGAALLIWAENAERRVALAERDVAGLTTPDSNAIVLLQRFGADLAAAPAPRSRADLLKLYSRSDLAAGGYPVALSAWSPAGDTIATLQLARFETLGQRVAQAVNAASAADTSVMIGAAASQGTQLILAVPEGSGPAHAVTAVVVAPATRLIAESPEARLFGLASAANGGTPAYSLILIRIASRHADTIETRAALRRWWREGEELHADWVVGGGFTPARAHVEIDLRSIDALAERGTLLLLLDLLVIALLWTLAAVSGGAVWRWARWRARGWARSYRAQLTVVLFAFFVTPALLFTAWSYRRLASDDRQSHALRVLETLRSVVNNGEVDFLQLAGDRLDTPLLLYRNGALSGASDTLFTALAPIGGFVRPDIELGLGLADELTADRVERADAVRLLFGYRAATDDRQEHVILAAPAGTDPIDDAALTRRRDDLSILVLFATAAGAVAALWLSGLVARRFARPIDALRRAALAAAAGAREPDLGGEPPAEFIPVYSAFRRMAADFGDSQRVLAWGQMARQVAHEIKNPLTPIRLGVQHLQRAHTDKRRDFDRILHQNVSRILAEIDRLDEIARAFSRYGTAPEERPPAEPTDVGAVARDVVELERLGADGVQWTVDASDTNAFVARARADELREVLLNLLENARLADAHRVRVRVDRDVGRVTVAVEDDGEGIPEDVMPRLFEPHFSTRTSGSGLGLAVSRRVVDGWGGTITVESQRGRGTVVTISLVATDRD